MYEGNEVYDEVKQNAKDQQHPVLPPTQEIPQIAYIVPGVEFKTIPGLNKRQMDLINNNDAPQANEGAARERRMEIIYRDISAINNFLPYMDQVRGFMSTMPHEDNVGLIEALAIADLQLRKFIVDVDAKLASLEAELALKKIVV